MLSKLIHGNILAEEEIKADKKRITSSVSTELFLLKLTLNDFTSAKEVLNELSKGKGKPHSLDLILGKVYLALVMNNISEAEELLDTIKDNTENPIETEILKVKLLMTQSKYTEVITLCEKTENPSYTILNHIQAHIYSNSTEKALALIKSSKTTFPNLLLILRLISSILKENYTKSLSHLEDCLQALGKIEDIYLIRGYIQLKLLQYSEAIESFNEVFELNNRSELAWHMSGISFFHLKNYNDSFSCISKCLQFNPKSTIYLQIMAKIYEKTEKPHLAKAFLDKAKTLDPELQVVEGLQLPQMDFSDFGKRKNCYLPPRVRPTSPVFVKPQVKKQSFKKSKKAKVREEEDSEIKSAIVLESLSSSLRYQGTKNYGFMPVSDFK